MYVSTVWDTQSGEIQGPQLIRYWEEHGGGIEALKSRYEALVKWRETTAGTVHEIHNSKCTINGYELNWLTCTIVQKIH